MRRIRTGVFRSLACIATLTAAAAVLQAQDVYGYGLSGSAPYPPSLSTDGPWMGNYNHALTVHGALPNTYGAFAVSFARDTSGSPLLVDLGAPLYAFAPAVTDAFGGSALALGYGPPVTPTLAGLPFYAQFGCVDPGSPIGIALSPGLAYHLSMPPLVFYGTSVAGKNDPWFVLDPNSATYATVASGTSGMNNVRAAVWANGGKTLWVACAFHPYLQMLDMTTSPPARHVITSATAGVNGLHLDRVRNILYSLSDTGNTLAAYDVAPGSMTYGTLLAQNPSAGVAMYTSSAMGKRGTRIWQAAALSPFLREFDTDPASATWLTNIGFVNVPMGANMATVNSISASDHGSGQLLCVIQGYGPVQGEVARRNLAANQWIDHNPGVPGVQNLGGNSSPPATPGIAPARVDIASDGRHAAIGAIGSSSGPGFPGTLAVLHLDPASPSFWSLAQLPLAGLTNNCWTASFLPDNQTIAFASWPPSRALVVDTTGLTYQNQTLTTPTATPLTNIYTCVAR